MPQLSQLAAGLALATAAALIPASALAATEPAAGPEIGGVTLSTETSGFSPYLPIGCGVVADFTDRTPSDPADYSIVVDGREQRGADPAHSAGEPVPGAFSASIPCDGLVDGEYDVVVREYAGEAVGSESAPATLSYRVIAHPSRMSVKATKVKGAPSLRAGTKIPLKSDGTWERGAKISTRIWTSKRKTFTIVDWDANAFGKAAALSKINAAAPVSTFKIPARFAGRWAWISVVGRTGEWGADGVADYRITFVPMRILPPK